LIFRAQEEQATCKSGALTQTGGKYSDLRRINLSTGRVAKSSKSKETTMAKEIQLVLPVTMVRKDRNGRFNILIKPRVQQRKVSTKTLVSTLTDHSILSQNFHSVELLSATVPTMSG
jgi:hypothetical protein